MSDMTHPTRRRRTVATTLVASAIGLFFLGTNWVVGAAADEPTTDTAIENLTTVDVQRQDLSVQYQADGTIEPTGQLNVVANSDGWVRTSLMPGAAVAPGTVLTRVDDRAVVAIEGDVPMWRELSVGDDGADVLQLELALVALGFDPDGTVTVDDEYTDATAAMVRDWQTSLGVDDSGSVHQGDLVVLTEPMRVSAVVADTGEVVESGDPLLHLATDGHIVSADIVLADAVTLDEGDTVSLQLPDRTTFAGNVRSIARGPDQTVRTVAIGFDDATPIRALGGVTVEISWTEPVAGDVLTLPADALRRLERGTYVVDVLQPDGSVESTDVDVGAVVGSFVEVSGVADGTTVLRP